MSVFCFVHCEFLSCKMVVDYCGMLMGAFVGSCAWVLVAGGVTLFAFTAVLVILVMWMGATVGCTLCSVSCWLPAVVLGGIWCISFVVLIGKV
jgi:hypothetical protein